jgi:adenosylcobinamide-GDP ribazoletransferase
MDKDDTGPLIDIRDVNRAIGLLTRLPVPVDGAAAAQRGAQAAWAYPIAGLVIAVFGGIVGQLCIWVGLPPQVIAVLVLLVLIVPTGALHEDGLADSADGLWGGWTAERRLEIMKDSNIGTYGVVALVLSLMLRGAALSALIAAGLLWPAVLIGAVVGRSSMVALMHLMPNARDNGLSHSVGRPRFATLCVALVISAVVALVLAPAAFGWVVMTCVLVAAACAMLAKVKIGGQTGDILGATGQIVEITALMVLVLSAL